MAEDRDFVFAGRLSLDFVATRAYRSSRLELEWLESPSDLGRWLVTAEVLESVPPVGSRGLASAHALREAIERLVRAALARTRPQPDDVDSVNRFATRMALAPQLGRDGRTVHWTAPRALEAALALVARDAIELLGGPLRQRIRECARRGCTTLFVDASRPRSRRWCSMDRCGNWTKTRRFRERARNRRQRPSSRGTPPR